MRPQCIEQWGGQGEVGFYRYVLSAPQPRYCEPGGMTRWCELWRGKKQTLRRARGYAPAPIRLPKGFEDTPPILAMGGELQKYVLASAGREKKPFSPSILGGDLENAVAFDDLPGHPGAVPTACLSTSRSPLRRGSSSRLPLYQAGSGTWPRIRICPSTASAPTTPTSPPAWWNMACPSTTPPVLGIALDGLGYGADEYPLGRERFFGGRLPRLSAGCPL